MDRATHNQPPSSSGSGHLSSREGNRGSNPRGGTKPITKITILIGDCGDGPVPVRRSSLIKALSRPFSAQSW